MSSDDAYASFLDKANEDLNAGKATTSSGQGKAKTKAVETGVEVPAPLTSVEEYYVSDADEPFEPVALKWEGAKQGTWPSHGG